MTSADAIAKALGARRAGPQKWAARCPAHKDRTPSLSIAEGKDGRTLVHCHAGCEQSVVIEALRGKGLWGNDFNPRTNAMRGATAEKFDDATIIIPIPDNAPPRPAAHPVLGEPTATWRYLDGEGRLSFEVWRFDTGRSLIR
jgi:hypothetical protein